MKALIVHNSDEVKACFIGTKKEIFLKLKTSEYWEDITNRLVDEDLSDEDVEEGWQVNNEKDITLVQIVDNLHHDGDSEDGYTLLEAT